MRRTYRSRTTVGQYMAGILPRLASRQQVPTWPPDVFALCASVLSESGAYCQVLDHWPPADLKGRWFRTAERIAKEWRECWLDGRNLPHEVRLWWATVREHWDHPVSEIPGNVPLAQALLQLCAVADECCEDVGSPQASRETAASERFRNRADELLQGDRFESSTLCYEVDPSRATVLGDRPKTISHLG